jgi:hypothetical protein
MTGSFTWPAHFSVNCPPAEAFIANGNFYRVVKTNPPQPTDFRSVYEIYPERARKAVEEGHQTKCETMGLSVYTDLCDAVACARKFRRLGKNIVRLSLTPDSGMEIHSQSRNYESHHTWWKPEGFDPIGQSRLVLTL